MPFWLERFRSDSQLHRCFVRARVETEGQSVVGVTSGAREHEVASCSWSWSSKDVFVGHLAYTPKYAFRHFGRVSMLIVDGHVGNESPVTAS